VHYMAFLGWDLDIFDGFFTDLGSKVSALD